MKKIIHVFFALYFCNVLEAQKCISDKVNYDLLKNNIELMLKHQEFYKEVGPVSNSKRATKYIIPVVFHVIHTNGPENISKEQIEDQIRILNQDYSYTNLNKSNIRTIFQNVAADFEIEFRLAKIDPQGNCTDGINRVYSSKHINAGDAVKSLPLARWSNQMYLNIWTVSSINSQGANGTILGYAYFPSTTDGASFSTIDGVLMRADCVGSIGTSNSNKAGRTLTHEVGHFLGLLHPFQDSCDGGDFCEDTPPVYGTFTNANCNPNVNSCSNDNPDLPDMFENYMDYSEGNCQAMFTKNQKAIVHASFINFEHRAHLVSAENLIATGVSNQQIIPLAGFNSNVRSICAGQSVVFTEISCQSQINSRSWVFEGGNITSSTSTAPIVTYSQPGKYKVSLTVSNSFGSNSLVKESFIEVFPAEAHDKGYLVQTFENPLFQPAEGWTLVKEENQVAFNRIEGVAYTGNASLVAPITGLTRQGKLYRIVSPKVDLRSISGLSPKLSFMCAYAKPNKTSADVLKVYVSTDCGNTWTLRYTRSEASLYSVGFASPQFVPKDKSEWRLHSIPLTFAQNQSNVMFMIEIESDAGGNVYIDDINVSQFNTSVNEINIDNNLQLYPVPAREQLNLVFESVASGDAIIEIKNLLGQVILTNSIAVLEGEQNINIQFDNSVSPGIYFVSVKIGTQVFINKLIVEGS